MLKRKHKLEKISISSTVLPYMLLTKGLLKSRLVYSFFVQVIIVRDCFCLCLRFCDYMFREYSWLFLHVCDVAPSDYKIARMPWL